ncbi:hydroxymethylglutaryl-CoA lyase [Alphaproteobacteria bacterium GH1-50]|uniref:hydroxymethylglutaryl-CoA lyase n=1 Tax=Kangsaoukella pontilimi TaxID=2691042 RepID=A0A7C9IHM5_9RHOB|nr:hydroxymethylglutaryl-CoA lyase [Kangsaoukella pontilimi]MXQ07782.1 hydroxymethylglutaryl-CoA lyase [Kangsaoukella pontilimi]
MSGDGDMVEIVEVGPRDGLQNETRAIPVAEKVALIDLLSEVGFRRIEAASFVSPRWVPQMAGSAEVMAGITRKAGVRYTALVPNLKGAEAAVAAAVDELAVFASASEGFSRANINASIDESLARFGPVMARAREAGLQVRGYISCVTDCPYDGPVAPEAVARVAAALFGMGCFEVSLGDTLGRAVPERVDAMLAAILDLAEPGQLAGHFHDTSGRALENVEVALGRGLRVFDASVAGLGGCPYAPGAAGNLSTGKLARFLADRGFAHGLNLELLQRAEAMAVGMREVRG